MVKPKIIIVFKKQGIDMTFTRQMRSLPVFDKSIQEINEVKKDLISINYGLDNLYKKLHKLNSILTNINTMQEEIRDEN